ncbi:uncharacterized protein METZ01_LOCUS362839 [marine metagenome]|uniref:Uncharacterized protein n=1 Tax=marine metagenome TaxID=408172 RepID=A0A382SKH1_9ZZZZ
MTAIPGRHRKGIDSLVNHTGANCFKTIAEPMCFGILRSPQDTNGLFDNHKY